MSVVDRKEAASALAFACMAHDVGKVVQRAGLHKRDADWQRLFENHQQQYCPFYREGGFFTHHHAALTAQALDRLSVHLPDMRNLPEGLNTHDGGLINVAARHHIRSDLLTPVERIVQLADRAASGFEREDWEQWRVVNENDRDYVRARLLSLLEMLDPEEKKAWDDQTLRYRMMLEPLSIKSLFPEEAPDREGSEQAYEKLWTWFEQQIKELNDGWTQSWWRFVQVFDALYLAAFHAVPASSYGTRPDVSLYDHSRAVAALGVALWHWWKAQDQPDIDADVEQRKSILLIQADMFGIQSFIFDDEESGNSQKQAAKLLRGRSFMISLLMEIAAVRLMDALELPVTSQVINAAGKFLIVAPNTPEVKDRLYQLQNEFDQWFLDFTYGMAGIGWACTEASLEDFQRKRFHALQQRLVDDLQEAKYARFDLAKKGGRVFEDYMKAVSKHGVCTIQGRWPANGESDRAWLTEQQIELGSRLTKGATHLIEYLPQQDKTLLGCRWRLVNESQALAALSQNHVLKVVDIRGAQGLDKNAHVFRGWPMRFINAWIPRQDDRDMDEALWGKFPCLSEEEQQGLEPDDPKTFCQISCEARKPDPERGGWRGICALGVLKGDVDDLGLLFQKGLQNREKGRHMTFAKLAQLSRLMDSFFSLYLPHLFEQKFPDTYTLFAGGDDFFLIGPYAVMPSLAQAMNEMFQRYGARNPALHFSIGLALTPADMPVRQLGEEAEMLLEQAKSQPGKHAMSMFGMCVEPMSSLSRFADMREGLDALQRKYPAQLSTRYWYALYELAAEAYQAQRGMADLRVYGWQSRFYYRTARAFEKDSEAANEVVNMLSPWLTESPALFRAALQLHLYGQRKGG